MQEAFQAAAVNWDKIAEASRDRQRARQPAPEPGTGPAASPARQSVSSFPSTVPAALSVCRAGRLGTEGHALCVCLCAFARVTPVTKCGWDYPFRYAE